MIKLITGFVVLLVTLGSALVGVDSFYARKQWTEEQFAEMDRSSKRTRYSQVLQDLARLARKLRTPDEERWYQSLLIERQLLCADLRLKKC